MESDILVDIKKKYASLDVSQCSTSYHLRGVATLELQPLSLQREGTRHTVRIRYRNLFKWHDPDKKLDRKVLLVEGEAGIGKTVLCKLITKDWAKGDLFQEFNIILLLPLNDRNVATAYSLPKLLSELYDLDERKGYNLASYLKGPHVKSILIIADGLDNLGQRELCEGSLLCSLLFGNLLPSNSSTTVMITSRPHCVSRRTLKTVNRFVYVKGITIETMQLCIHSEFNSPADKAIASYLIEQLDNNPLLQSMCSVPFILAMILSICRSMPCDRPLPDTLTDLYTKICWAHVETNIKCMEQYKDLKSLSSYCDLPEDLRKSWWCLCELAFKNIEGGSNTSWVDATMIIMSIEIVSFGFLKPVSENDTTNFKFLHPALEQYLAALHLVKQSQGIQLEFIKAHSSDKTLVHYFWRFFFGMCTDAVLKVKPDDTVVVQVVQMLSKLHHSSNDEYLLCHYSFEAKCKLVSDEVINALNTTKDRALRMTLHFGNTRDAHDCTAMIYVMENIDQQCYMEINFQRCCLNYQHIDKLAGALSFRFHNVQVKGLDLSDNILNDSAVADFFHKAAITLQSLERLSLRSCGIRTKAVSAIMNVLIASSSSQSLKQLDLSYNPLSESCLRTIQDHMGSLLKVEIFSLKGSVPIDIDLDYLATLMDIVSNRCEALRRLDLSDNYLGESDSPILRKMILQLTNNKSSLDLRLNDEYMPIVNENFISAMEESIKNKGTIDHTVAHGIIVGPGRSGKNTLMNRLIGKGPPDPKFISSSTGVLEKIVKVEVKNLCTVATTVCNLKWQRLEYDEEALELMMSTAKYHSVSSPSPKLRQYKYIQKPQRSKDGKENKQLHASNKNPKSKVSPEVANPACQIEDPMRGDGSTNKMLYIRSSDVAPVELFKNALKLRRINGLREQLESSWSLYLTNTGGQPEFQEYLPFLISGPTVFFITFPLHYDLHKPYSVEYQYPDGTVKSYPSPTTLMEELLQTLATINALSYTSSSENELNIRPKVYFIGTHKDCLQDAETIHEIDKQIKKCVKQTSLYHQGTIQFAQSSKQMIFTVNNLSDSEEDFQKIRSVVQQTVTEKCFREFTVKCPTSWLVFSLILREKYQSNRVLHIDDCLVIARECGISSSKEMVQALSFIHSRLGLIRYYNVEGLNTLVVVDPQIIFDKISELIINTFTSDHAEENEIEDFKHKGIFSEALMKKISDKCCSSLQLPPFTWLANLLNYLRIAALFKDRDGTRKYFFPSALAHAPKIDSKQVLLLVTIPPALIAFESGFCPRGIAGALIKCLMTNEMKSRRKWELLPHKIYRNQVSFHIQACGVITLKSLPTHLEICIENTTKTDSKATCEEAYTQIEKCIKMVTSQYIKCKHFWRFNCTVAGCKTDPHPAKIEWSGDVPKQLWCKISLECGDLPNGYEIWNIHRKSRKGLMSGALDRKIDEDGVPRHLGKIAAFMDEWEGPISDNLELTVADVESIKKEYPSKLILQTRAALLKWNKTLGKNATYNNLISVFEAAGYRNYAENIRRMFGGDDETDDSSGDESFPRPQPPTYPVQFDELSSEPLSAKSLASSEFYDLIDSVAAKTLPEGDCHDCDMMQDPNVIFLPKLHHSYSTGPQQVCKLPGCNRPRFMEPGGKMYDFCGKPHALQYQQQNAPQIPQHLQCARPGCMKQKHPNDKGGYFDYCSRYCQDHGVTSASTPNLPSTAYGTCSLPECQHPKYRDPANGRIHDHCGRSHAAEARARGLQPSNPMMVRQANQQEFSKVSQQFTRDWDWRKGTCPQVSYVYMVSNSALEARWSAYRKNFQDQTVEEYYHGTKLICNLSNMPCTNTDCGVCGISNMGLDRRCIRKNINFQRFGHGFYLAPNSSKCHDYTQGANGYRAMLLCAVCPGRKYVLQTDHVTLKGPPAGYDCVFGKEGSSLNYAEIVIYNPDAVVPRYIIVYQKDGVHKIAK